MRLIKLLSIPTGSQVTIRVATPEDARGIIVCMNKVMEERVYLLGEQYSSYEEFEAERIRSMKEDLALVAEASKEIVGVLFLNRGKYRKNRHTAYLSIAVLDKYRKIGIGTMMIQSAVEWAKENDIEKLTLEVFSSNLDAMNLYKKLGFTVSGVWRRQFKIDGQYVDDVLMELFL